MWRVEPTISTARTVMMLRSAVVALPTAILSPRVLKPALSARYHEGPIFHHPPNLARGPRAENGFNVSFALPRDRALLSPSLASQECGHAFTVIRTYSDFRLQSAFRSTAPWGPTAEKQNFGSSCCRVGPLCQTCIKLW